MSIRKVDDFQVGCTAGQVAGAARLVESYVLSPDYRPLTVADRARVAAALGIL